ncbi:MAG: hypothetical protein EON59_07235 [Alphaproteobacteria bacterium]|nr:MAG: hypothetical protein EON59_07235 [Alphaproteobacteria bacterium]
MENGTGEEAPRSVAELRGALVDLAAPGADGTMAHPDVIEPPASRGDDRKVGRISEGEGRAKHGVPLYLEEVAPREASFRQGQTIPASGAVTSNTVRSLNPLFVEWLMGWPPGWTLIAWTDFACSATALSLWTQHMRSVLSQLGLPAEAPPAQLGLFG